MNEYTFVSTFLTLLENPYIKVLDLNPMPISALAEAVAAAWYIVLYFIANTGEIEIVQ